MKQRSLNTSNNWFSLLNVCEERKWQENKLKLSIIFFSKKQFLHPPHPPISSISYMFCATWLPPLPSEYLLLVVLHSHTLAAGAPSPFLPLQRDSPPLAAALSSTIMSFTLISQREGTEILFKCLICTINCTDN